MDPFHGEHRQQRRRGCPATQGQSRPRPTYPPLARRNVKGRPPGGLRSLPPGRNHEGSGASSFFSPPHSGVAEGSGTSSFFSPPHSGDAELFDVVELHASSFPLWAAGEPKADPAARSTPAAENTTATILRLIMQETLYTPQQRQPRRGEFRREPQSTLAQGVGTARR